MNTREAVAKRILELCEEKNIAVNALANLSGVTPNFSYLFLFCNEKAIVQNSNKFCTMAFLALVNRLFSQDI